jgi:hypothetical protein
MGSFKTSLEIKMKYISLLVAIFILLSFGGCTLVNDTPSHTADEVITIAKSFSPQCRLQLPAEPSHG